VAEMLFELCVTELEDVAADKEVVRSVAQPVMQESPHPYTDDTAISGSVRIPGGHTLHGHFICCVIRRLPLNLRTCKTNESLS
jgi:E3 ubiquitin-protein ligase HERC2